MNRYVKFPEMWWRILKARPTTDADWRIAIALLEKAKFSRVVRLTSHECAKIGISTRTRLRSLNRLGAWGLIPVRSRQKASPLITVRYLAGRQPSDG